MLKRVVFVGQEPMTRDHIWAPLAHEFEYNGWKSFFEKMEQPMAILVFIVKIALFPEIKNSQ
jgi:hypothetical protein